MHDRFKPIIAGAHVELRPTKEDAEAHPGREPADIMLDTGEKGRIRDEVSAGHTSGEARGAIAWRRKGAAPEEADAFEHARIAWHVMAG